MTSPREIAHFNRICAAIALAWLILVIAASFLIRPTDQDFRQYYMGALMARHGDWSALYPRVRPGGIYNAAYPDQADTQPAYDQRAKDAGVPAEGYRFIQPPIDAALLLPLAWLPYRAALAVWTALLVLATWGVAMQSGKIFQLVNRRESPWCGVITLLVACSVLAYRAIRVGNLSPMIAFSLGVMLLTLPKDRPLRGAAALWFGAITKYASLALLPVIIAMRRLHWLLIAGALLLLSTILTLILGGFGPFLVFLRDIAPTLARPHPARANQSLAGFLLRVAGEPMPRAIALSLSATKWISLLLLLAAVFSRRPRFWKRPENVLAASCALICWMLIFSPIYWEHYPIYLCPFWGWLIWESLRSPLWLIGTVFAILSMWLPLQALPHFTYPEPLNSHILWGTILMLGLAGSRLLASEG